MALGRKTERDESEGSTEKALRGAIDAEMERDESSLLEDETGQIKEPKRADATPVLHTGEAGIDGDEVDFYSLKRVTMASVKPVSFKKKVRLYWIYLVVFGLMFGLMVVAFWDAFTIRGQLTPWVGFTVSLPVMAVVYWYIVEIRERVDSKYPTWFDVNSKTYFHYEVVAERDGYLYIAPFEIYKQRKFVPDNPMKPDSPLLVAIDTKAIRTNQAGMVTLGKLNFDMSGMATFRLDYDTDYIPNPDIHNLMFELNVIKSQLKSERELKVETDIKYRNMRKIKFDDEFELLMRHIRMLIPTLSLMLRSKEQDVVTDIAVMEQLKEQGFDVDSLGSGQRNQLVNELKRRG